MSVWRHVRAIGLCPGMVTVVVPALIVWRTEAVEVGWRLPGGLAFLPVVLGAALIVLGLLLVTRTVALFAAVGRGTLAPWDPPRGSSCGGPTGTCVTR